MTVKERQTGRLKESDRRRDKRGMGRMAETERNSDLHLDVGLGWGVNSKGWLEGREWMPDFSAQTLA